MPDELDHSKLLSAVGSKGIQRLQKWDVGIRRSGWGVRCGPVSAPAVGTGGRRARGEPLGTPTPTPKLRPVLVRRLEGGDYRLHGFPSTGIRSGARGPTMLTSPSASTAPRSTRPAAQGTSLGNEDR